MGISKNIKYFKNNYLFKQIFSRMVKKKNIEDDKVDNYKKDEEMNIDTTGLIDWPHGVNLDYFRTESTSYKDLDRFIHSYVQLDNPYLVDFGSGKGRIVFYFNHELDIPTTAIEVNRVAFSYLQKNYIKYQEKFPEKAHKLTILEEKAEDYQVKKEDNIFYFFNPFTLKIFKKVIRQIEHSLREYPREADIILYYPGYDYTFYLEKYSMFGLIQTIKTPMYPVNNRECFKVFRYIPKK